MAMLFSANVHKMWLARIGIKISGANSTPFTSAVTVYSGAQPTAATIAAGFSSYNSTNAIFLAHYQSIPWSVDGTTLAFYSIGTPPAAPNASNTGTGAWAIIWWTNPALASMGGAIPTTSFMVVPVSVTSQLGVIRFASLSFTSGAANAITDGAFRANF